MPLPLRWWIDPWPYLQAAFALTLCALLMWRDRRRNGRNDHNAWTIAFGVLMVMAVVNPMCGVFASRWWVYTLHSLPAGTVAFVFAIKLAECFSERTTLQMGPGMMGFVAPPSVWVAMIGLAGIVRLLIELIATHLHR